MLSWSMRSVLRKLKRDATIKESVDDVADQFVARSLAGVRDADIEGIVEAIDRRQQNLDTLYNTLTRYGLFIFLILIVSTLPAAQQASEIQILGLPLKQDAILQFRVILLLVGGVCAIIGAVTLHSQRSLAAIQRALLRMVYPSDAVALASHKYSMDRGIPYTGDLAFFEKEPMYNKWRPMLSHIVLFISFAVVVVCLMVAGLYIQFQILADLYNRPSGPAWITYCAIAIVLLTDVCLLFFYIDTNRKRRVVYYSALQSRMDEWLAESRRRNKEFEASLDPQKLALYKKRLAARGLDPDSPIP